MALKQDLKSECDRAHITNYWKLLQRTLSVVRRSNVAMFDEVLISDPPPRVEIPQFSQHTEITGKSRILLLAD